MKTYSEIIHNFLDITYKVSPSKTSDNQLMVTDKNGDWALRYNIIDNVDKVFSGSNGNIVDEWLKNNGIDGDSFYLKASKLSTNLTTTMLISDSYIKVNDSGGYTINFYPQNYFEAPNIISDTLNENTGNNI